MVKWNGLLPMSSIVMLEGSDQTFMIIGQVQADPKTLKVYDYVAVPFPEGYQDENYLFKFQHEDIRIIGPIGHLDDGVWEALAYLENLRDDLRSGRITVQQILDERKKKGSDGQNTGAGASLDAGDPAASADTGASPDAGDPAASGERSTL